MELSLFIGINVLIASCYLVDQVLCDQSGEEFWKVNDSAGVSPINRLLVIGVIENAPGETFARFNSSLEAFGLRSKLILPFSGSGKLVQASRGLETKKNIFNSVKEAVAEHKNEKDLVIMVILESQNSLVNGDQAEILQRFSKLVATTRGDKSDSAKVVVSADTRCWPDENLVDQFPPIKSELSRRFLDAQALIGFASSVNKLYEAIAAGRALGNKSSHKDAADSAKSSGPAALSFDLQAELTNVYLNETARDELGLLLDHTGELFWSLDTKKPYAEDELELDYSRPGSVQVRSIAHGTRPVIVHARGFARIALNWLGNYLGRAWTPADGCVKCNSSKISLRNVREVDMPRVLVGLFIEEPTPFMELFYQTLTQLDYPKRQMHLFIHNNVEYHSQGARQFLASSQAADYASLELKDSTRGMSEWQARNYGLAKCKQLNCDYYLSLDSIARLDRAQSLRELIETNRTIVAPVLSRPRKLWSNFWASINVDGYYRRSHDYVDLVSRQRTGVWSVPLVMDCYLIEGKFLRRQLESQQALLASGQGERLDGGLTSANDQDVFAKLKLNYYDERYPKIKPALIFGRNLRQAEPEGVMQYASNEQEFGHLLDASHFNLSRVHPDFYELESNMLDWQQVYMHDQYFDLFDERDEEEGHPGRIRLESPCQDVYWFPLVSERFCSQLIEIMEAFGQWSAGTNHDPRIEGGYESVPTRDIHFRQVGLHQMWLYFLRQFVMPIQMKEYIGYEHDPPRTDLAFVVRYNPSEQPSLRPHHDSSTYTINIALNTPGLDYEGGGCRFVRYNCSVTESRPGWALIHPGRLTHYHEGLPVTKGTRYIMVTFVDP